jgi:rod shape-determining protein MreD
MMSRFRFIVLLVLLFIIHLLFYQYLAKGKIYPDLFLVLIIFAALRWGAAAGCVSGFLCGMVQDSFSYSFFGLHALCKTLIGFAIGKSRQAFYSNNILVQFIIIFSSKFIHDLIFYSIFLSRQSGSFWTQLFVNTSLNALYTCIIGLLLYHILNFRS